VTQLMGMKVRDADHLRRSGKGRPGRC
jgi:hypothetical protein